MLPNSSRAAWSARLAGKVRGPVWGGGAVRGEEPYPVTAQEVLNGVAAFEAVPLSAERGVAIRIG